MMHRVNNISSIISLLLKIFVLVAIIGIGLLIYQTCSGSPLVQRIDKITPGVEVAKYEITSMTRIYYSNDAFKNSDGSVTMRGFYENHNGHWEYVDAGFTIKPVLRPRIIERLSPE